MVTCVRPARPDAATAIVDSGVVQVDGPAVRLSSRIRQERLPTLAFVGVRGSDRPLAHGSRQSIPGPTEEVIQR